MIGYKHTVEEIIYRIGNIANRSDLKEVQQSQIDDLLKLLYLVDKDGFNRAQEMYLKRLNNENK